MNAPASGPTPPVESTPSDTEPRATTRHRCSRKGWCNAMARMARPSSSQNLVGLQVVTSDRIDTKGVIVTRLWGVACRSSSKDKGVFLNQCPWCGASILWAERPNIIARG